MAGLVLKLKAGERVLVNGAVLESVDRPSRLRVLTRDTDILRLRDAIDPAEAETPVGRLANILQMIVAGAVPKETAEVEARDQIALLRTAFNAPEDIAVLDKVAFDLDANRPYPALRALRDLRKSEAALLKLTAKVS